MASLDPSRGLHWGQTFLFTEPKWTYEPDITAIKHTTQALRPSSSQQDLQVSFLTQGAFNKLYTIRTADEELILRVSSPVDPGHKTASEVATLTWVAARIDLAVPRVLDYCDNRNNAIDFE